MLSQYLLKKFQLNALHLNSREHMIM